MAIKIMNKKNLGVFIFLFAILIANLMIVSATTCNTLCIDKGFEKGISSNQENCGEGIGSFREFTDEKKREHECCCTGNYNRAAIGKNNPLSGGDGLMSIIGIDIGGISKWIIAYEKGEGIGTAFIKYLILIMVFVLAYSSFSIVKFPEETGLRAILAIVISILFTIIIRPEELLAVMINFKSVGLTMLLVFPMFVLAMFSFAMAVQVNAMGIVLQRVMWGIYCAFLFINSGLTLLAGQGAAADSIFMGSLIKIADALGGTFFAGADKTISTTLLVASIIIFFTMVLNNKLFIKQLTEEVTDAKTNKYENVLKKAQAKMKADAKAIDNA